MVLFKAISDHLVDLKREQTEQRNILRTLATCTVSVKQQLDALIATIKGV